MNLKTTSNANLSYHFQTEKCVWIQYPETLSPVTISICHDGLPRNDFLGLAPLRLEGSSLSDMKVWSLVKGISWGVPLNVVRGLIPRAFIDYNRGFSGKDIPYVDSLLEKSYLHFHSEILSFVKKSKNLYGKTLFIDMHGFTNQPLYGNYDIILGTGNRSTVNSDIDIRLAEFLRRESFSVFLPKKETYQLNTPDSFNGGFTVRSIFEKTLVDSIQIEVHSSVRKDYKKSLHFSKIFRKALKDIFSNL